MMVSIDPSLLLQLLFLSMALFNCPLSVRRTGFEVQTFLSQQERRRRKFIEVQTFLSQQERRRRKFIKEWVNWFKNVYLILKKTKNWANFCHFCFLWEFFIWEIFIERSWGMGWALENGVSFAYRLNQSMTDKGCKQLTLTLYSHKKNGWNVN